MALIKMTKTTRGSINGIQVEEYEAGHEYNLPERLVSVFVDQLSVAFRVIAPVEKEIKDEEKEELKEKFDPKMLGASPMNKSVSKSPQEKPKVGKLSRFRK